MSKEGAKSEDSRLLLKVKGSHPPRWASPGTDACEGPDGKELYFNVKKTTQFQKVMSAYCKKVAPGCMSADGSYVCASRLAPIWRVCGSCLTASEFGPHFFMLLALPVVFI